jgi:hypothetical protein
VRNARIIATSRPVNTLLTQRIDAASVFQISLLTHLSPVIHHAEGS